MNDDPPGLAAWICAACSAPITRALEPVSDLRLIARLGWDPWVPQGSWSRAEREGSPFEKRLTDEHPIAVHPHDLLGAQLIVSGFGCCGYTPSHGPNLHCRCGAPVGLFVDECSFRIEVRLAARSAAGDASTTDASTTDASTTDASARGISQRLDRLASTRLDPMRSYPDTRWGWRACDVESVSPREIAFALAPGPDGLVAQLIVDERSIALGLPATTLARAIALQRLPVGNDWLALSYGLRDEANRILRSTGLVRREHEIEIIEEVEGRARGWRVWDEWLDDAWEQAVDRWMSTTSA